MSKALLYIHGKNGRADEADHYRQIFDDLAVVGLDYQSETPWATREEFLLFYQKLAEQYTDIYIIANSIGAYLAMNAWANVDIKRAFFISPVADMEKLIIAMLEQAGISETELAAKKRIVTSFGETISWEYLCYVRTHPLLWNVPTDILYGEKDNLISIDTISRFAEQYNASLTVMPNGEHWFHTAEQMDFLDQWLKQCLKKEQ